MTVAQNLKIAENLNMSPIKAITAAENSNNEATPSASSANNYPYVELSTDAPESGIGDTQFRWAKLCKTYFLSQVEK